MPGSARKRIPIVCCTLPPKKVGEQHSQKKNAILQRNELPSHVAPLATLGFYLLALQCMAPFGEAQVSTYLKWTLETQRDRSEVLQYSKAAVRRCG